jgi:hypothetical protein
MLRDQESTRAIHISSKHKEGVYEKANREVKMSQYVKSNAMNNYLENHLYLNHSKQKTEIIKAHVLLPKASILHVKIGREVSKSWNPKGYSVDTWEPKTWIQLKYTQLILRVSKMQNLVRK